MANIYRVLLLLLPLTLTAQLTVKPDQNGNPSFVYIKGSLVYIENNIELTANNSTEVPASIYLREQAQLVQGDDQSTDNSGDGLLSVYQDSRSDSYDYNYWSPPVTGQAGAPFTFATNLVDATDTLTARSVEYQNVGFYNGQGRSGIDYSDNTQLKISPRWLYRWEGVNQAWVHLGGSGAVQSGYGFTMKGTNQTTPQQGTTTYIDANNQYYEFRGLPNSGDIPVQVQLDNVGTSTRNSNFIGNPYPSALDLAAFYLDPANTEIQEVLYWDEDRTINSHYYVDNKGGYGTWVPGNSDLSLVSSTGDYTVPTFFNYNNNGTQGSSTGAYGDNVPRRYVPIAQGFIATTTPSGVGQQNVVFKNSHRVYQKKQDTISVFRSPVVESKLRLHIIFGNYTHFRDLLLKFTDNATQGFDRGMDANHPMDATLQDAYFSIDDDVNGDKNLVIQSVKFNPNLAIPISFRLDVQGRIRLKAAEELNTPYRKVYLYDRVNNVRYPIRGAGNTIDVATAQLTLPAGTYEDRFYIMFEMPVEIPPLTEDQRNTTQATTGITFLQDNRAQQLKIRNIQNKRIQEINIYDTAGRLVRYQYPDTNAGDLVISTSNLSTGTYLVYMVVQDSKLITTKIIVKNNY
tara:strand:- start:1523 stop:3406 length:1884 start_codon:yes stop_codon:yes gene_type:complete